MNTADLALCAPAASGAFAARIGGLLGIDPLPIEERDFEDGEHKARPLASVRGRDVYVVHSLYGEPGNSANDKLLRLLFLVAALRDDGARRVHAVVPYLCYARKDAKTQPRDPTSSRYVAQLFEALGAEGVIAVEVHNPAAFYNAFRIGAEHVTTASLFAEHLAPGLDGPVVVVSPDPGGFKRAERLRAALSRRLRGEVTLAMMEKTRARGRMTSGRLVGEVEGRTAIVVDDIVASGATLAAAAEACRAEGGTRVIAVATHGLFVSPACATLRTAAIDRIFVTDSVPPFRLDDAAARAKVETVSLAPLLAGVIRGLHAGESLTALYDHA